MTDLYGGPTSSYQPEYIGRRWRVFWLALTRGLIAILTLGIGRFWMITRLRRYYWSSVLLDGAPFEYTGRPLEKLIGFFIAVVFLAVYLTAVNLTLAFVGFSYLGGDQTVAIIASTIAVAPLMLWAQYRARRYILARTRWRGIRFGVGAGAFGYMVRGVFWWLAVLMSFGFLYPAMQMDMARFAVDRTFFGDLRFSQEGRVWPLMRSWLWVWAPIVALLVYAVVNWDDLQASLGASAQDIPDEIRAEMGEIDPAEQAAAMLAMPALLWFMFGYVRHKIFSFRYLNSNRLLAGKTGFTVTLGMMRVVMIYLVGGFIIGLIVGLVGLVLAGFGVGVSVALDPAAMSTDTAYILGAAVGVGVYLVLVLFVLALSHAFITQPLLRATCRATRVHGLSYATRARQRAHDPQGEAGGFADALGADVGGAF